MAQHDYIISNQTFPNTRADINNLASAIATNNSGTSAPTTQYAGQFWIDTTSTTWTLYIHDGTDDIQFATIDTSANTVNFVDSALDVVTDTTPRLGGDLDLNSNDITGTGNINITGNITASGNLAGTLTTASQTNITSVGTLTSLDVGGTITSDGLEVVNDSNNGGISISGSTNPALTLIDTTNNTDAVIQTTNVGSLLLDADYNNEQANSTILFRLDGASEKMRIDSSGNVLVSTTDTTPSENNDTGGISLRSNGQVNVSVDGGAGLDINRKTSDGQILRLRKDGVDVGSIGSSPNFNIQRASGAGFNFGTTNISPLNSGVLSDNTIDLGFSSYRWNDLYLGGNIYLGGTGSANALDDYEEGTWTPSAETGTITFSNPKYTKIGRQVFLTGSIQSFSNTTTAINVKILGVPFQVDGEASGGVMARYFSGSISGDALTYYMQDNTSQIIFYITANNSNFESLQHADLTSGAAQMYFSISYMTD